ncbi:MAG: DUF2325 domain-containing protein [Azovibrio sp.]
MADFPFNVMGSVTGAIDGIKNTFAPALTPSQEIRASGSRRRRLWEIPHKFHCPVIGVCFACDELRGLMDKVMHFPKNTSDFVLHTTAVGTCETRTPLAELLQKTLEKRYQLTIKQFSVYKTNTELRTAWQLVCKEMIQLPAALWAIWTHPACDNTLEQDIYADIHMIQHQVGAGTRADLKVMKSSEARNVELQHQLETMQVELENLRLEKAASNQILKQQLNELRAELAVKAAWGAGLQRELASLRAEIPDLAERQLLLQQRDHALEQNAEFRASLEEKDKELVRLREFARYAEETLEALAQEDEAMAELPTSGLGGKCVLCVGGRSGAVHSYREVVEQSGGRFLHHDGGLEESLHRIDGALAAADIVICQAGCISHNAYWRVKDLCKRTGKPCMFVKNSGVSSFGRIVSEAGKKTA